MLNCEFNSNTKYTENITVGYQQQNVEFFGLALNTPAFSLTVLIGWLSVAVYVNMTISFVPAMINAFVEGF